MSVRAALEAEWALMRGWIDTVPTDVMDRASALDGWTVRDLLVHFGLGVAAVSGVDRAERATAPAVTGGAYVGAYAARADVIAEGARRTAAEHADDVPAFLDARWADLTAAMDRWGDDERAVLASRQGPMRIDELLRTRLVEAVVHGDDLARSVPEIVPPTHDPAALREVVRVLLAALVERAPGGSVEVRVPPFAVVQCVEGTSHTRGTPPNTVEADALTWVRVACGRVAWADAESTGSLRASGTRSDLSALLPLL